MSDSVMLRMTFPHYFVDEEARQLAEASGTQPLQPLRSERSWAGSRGAYLTPRGPPEASIGPESGRARGAGSGTAAGDNSLHAPKAKGAKVRTRSRKSRAAAQAPAGSTAVAHLETGAGDDDDDDWWDESRRDDDFEYTYYTEYGDESEAEEQAEESERGAKGKPVVPAIGMAGLALPMSSSQAFLTPAASNANTPRSANGTSSSWPHPDESAPWVINVRQEVEDALLALNVQNAHWTPGFSFAVTGESIETYCVTFPVLGGKVEPLLQRLIQVGIGVTFGDLSLVPLELTKPINMVEATEQIGIQGEFAKQIMAELVIQQVVDDTKRAAEFSFDYVTLCVVASLLAGVGLATDNVVVVVASMLVSPIMGPIMELTFGTIIRDWKLSWQGLWKELVGLAICFVVGGLVGLGFAAWGDDLDWPNSEMSSRGTGVGLLIGIAIAVPSGVGVALSTISQNTNSLVGVAISASLLPPAVNAGLNFCYAVVGQTFTGSTVDEVRHMRIGSLSFALTLINIVCVYFAAILMFWIKEVSKIPGKTAFWRHYVPAFRKHRESDAVMGLDADAAKRFQSEFQTLLAALSNPDIGDETIVKVDGQDRTVGELRHEYADLIEFLPVAAASATMRTQRGPVFSPMRTLKTGTNPSGLMAYNTVMRSRNASVPTWAQFE
ncbi:uncharacterized protein AMSG_00424 [Thecamonas trahens ATCC 50062]|uniref:DUF389 domain-containing protein n=1 Tax=Thecamonas trahens ATCC 50062 TaxID=461836 RepID=A0A0L0D8F2_THETB|nr:hypothetical protein AMSG_00424 [Thecamonas trahens ATCC 50062]KNC48647.1 hypothetical protein AMSG_00424 [Thecamonas trahens ATCC 50062]|eukprot:XP_013762703.1 hypothetical protein AMSG_00424 [Thecamonas trahens ATCC 50062]